MNDAIEKALLTWYPKDHELHMDTRHPAIKLAGEAGEILDLYGKDQYKPGFDWWNCKHCGQDRNDHLILSFVDNHKLACNIDYKKQDYQYYTPLVLDELGDLYYYLRILAYQNDVEFITVSCETINNYMPDGVKYDSDDMYNVLSALSYLSSQYSITLRVSNFSFMIVVMFNILMDVLLLLDTNLNELTELNYIKLNSDSTNHGWKGA